MAASVGSIVAYTRLGRVQLDMYGHIGLIGALEDLDWLEGSRRSVGHDQLFFSLLPLKAGPGQTLDRRHKVSASR
jgi:hypothetical protein